VLGVVVTLGVVLGAGSGRVSAQASDPRIGTWTLNVEKSKYNPGPAPQRVTLKIEASGQGEKYNGGRQRGGHGHEDGVHGAVRRQGLSPDRVADRRHGVPQAHRRTDHRTHGQEGR